MKNITISLMGDIDFNALFKSLEYFSCVITFNNCGGSFFSIFSGSFTVVCREEDYSEIVNILANFC